jgi:hypothetical protein
MTRLYRLHFSGYSCRQGLDVVWKKILQQVHSSKNHHSVICRQTSTILGFPIRSFRPFCQHTVKAMDANHFCCVYHLRVSNVCHFCLCFGCQCCVFVVSLVCCLHNRRLYEEFLNHLVHWMNDRNFLTSSCRCRLENACKEAGMVFVVKSPSKHALTNNQHDAVLKPSWNCT